MIMLPADCEFNVSPVLIMMPPLPELDAVPLLTLMEPLESNVPIIEDMETPETPEISTEPPAVVFELELAAADKSTDPPLEPLPPRNETEPPECPKPELDPDTKEMSPEESLLASPVDTNIDPLEKALLTAVLMLIDPLFPCKLVPLIRFT
jgi:hypothetical protein